MAGTLTCFVITGFGKKADLLTQRTLDMDLVYKKMLKPVCDEFKDPQIDCFRACDKLYTGTIDSFMYRWIFEADIAIADISTLNPNAIYELGVRYALKPYSTIVISEDQLKFPFDFNHVLIHTYKHAGNDIDEQAIKEFSNKLRQLVAGIIPQLQEKDANDSPVYDYLKADIAPPKSKKKKQIKKEWDTTLVKVIKNSNVKNIAERNLLNKVSQDQVTQLLDTATTGNDVAASANKDVLKEMYRVAFDKIGLKNKSVDTYGPYQGLFDNIGEVGFTNTSFLIQSLSKEVNAQKAKGMDEKSISVLPEVSGILKNLKQSLSEKKLSLAQLLEKAEEAKNDNRLRESLAYFALALDLDATNIFIIQRIVLLTYKSESPDRLTACKLAEQLLKDHLRPDEVIDVETLGLAGAIYKRLAEVENEKENISKSLRYYGKGFLISNDYYNGINCAFMYILRASKTKDKMERTADYVGAQKVWKDVIDICDAAIKKNDDGGTSKDLVWILQSKAQALLGLNGGRINKHISALLSQIAVLDNQFSKGTFEKQNKKLTDLVALVQSKL
ncbi:hypothetical protein DC498_06150 [Terrimonas sp.]|uniref:tetratricopeptide repeat-containing protein n=1 Tax=Terrimonas sp. TaxID=1914338 RepID=UPI000D51D34C|nr:tetratricopeptide repeat-containing protein [Terrimonas sp.]PVD52948.1 hypothetical protein DC498_06150 [Terrimonas sp.]